MNDCDGIVEICADGGGRNFAVRWHREAGQPGHDAAGTGFGERSFAARNGAAARSGG
jgi:hypothetical protein